MPSAALLVAVGLAILIGPTVTLTVSLVETAQALAKDLHRGALSVPPPPKSVASWPVVGDRLFALWSELPTPEGYVYPHDRPGHFVRAAYLPERLAGRRFYEPSDQGDEVEIGARQRRRRQG